jgi:hypothetical protein
MLDGDITQVAQAQHATPKDGYLRQMGEAELGGCDRAGVRGFGALTMLCLLLGLSSCGGGDPASRADAVLDCLRGSGATVEEGPRYSFPGAAIESFQLTLKSGSFAGVEVFRSQADAHARLSTGPDSVRKGRTVVLYPGRSEADATLLEDCLSAAPGRGLRRGDLARQVRRRVAREAAQRASYRNRSYSTPAAIAGVLERLRSYRRYRLYYPGRRVGRLPLRGVGSRLQPPAYEQRTRRRPPPISPAFFFTYGSCKPPPGSEGGCAAPLSVQNFEICAVNPNSYGLRPGQLSRRIRGVPVLRKDRGLELFTGHTTISISADSWDIAARAIESLRSFDGRIRPKAKLPPPAPGALEGRLRCRRPTKDELRAAP